MPKMLEPGGASIPLVDVLPAAMQTIPSNKPPVTTIASLPPAVGPNIAAILAHEQAPAGPLSSTAVQTPQGTFVPAPGVTPSSAPSPTPVAAAPPTKPAGAAPPGPTVVAPDWVRGVLFGVGGAYNDTTIMALTEWAASEGMPDSDNNWLAVTEPGFGGSVIPGNTDGVRRYPSASQGINATAAFMQGSNYNQVRKTLQDGSDIAAIYLAINESKWCSGCQGGLYPIALYNYIQKVGAGVGQVPGTTPVAPGVKIPAAANGFQDVATAAFKTLPAHVTNASSYAGRFLSAVS